MGNKVDYEELPRIIFQPNIFKNALQMILRTTDELQVCPRINDPTLLDNMLKEKDLNCYTKLTITNQFLIRKLLNV